MSKGAEGKGCLGGRKMEEARRGQDRRPEAFEDLRSGDEGHGGHSKQVQTSIRSQPTSGNPQPHAAHQLFPLVMSFSFHTSHSVSFHLVIFSSLSSVPSLIMGF